MTESQAGIVSEPLTPAAPEFGEVEIVGEDQYPATASVKLNGPPGTGKTTQLQKRVVELLSDGYGLDDITFITYRREMAAEFLRRLEQSGHVDAEMLDEPWAHEEVRHFGTIHAVCNRISGLSTRDVVTNADRREFFVGRFNVPYDGRGTRRAGNIPDPEMGSKMYEAYQWAVTNRADSLAEYPGLLELRESWPRHPSLVEFRSEWDEYKRENELRDFTDMLRHVDENRTTPPGNVLVVDEYHDFTPVMAAITERWMDDAEITIVGGDPLQAIYSYKGASPRFFEGLDLPEVVLGKTYRVPSNIWEYAQGVIDHATPPVEPASPGGTVKPAEGPPTAVWDAYGDEGTVMYLARTKSQVSDLCAELAAGGVIYRSQSRLGGWNDSPRRLRLYNALARLDGVGLGSKANPRTGQFSMGAFGDGSSGDESAYPPSSAQFTPEEVAELVAYTPAKYFVDTKSSVESVVGERSMTGEDLRKYVKPIFWEDMTNGPMSVVNLLAYDGKDTIEAALARNGEPVESIETADCPDVLTIHASKGKEADTVALYDGIPPKVVDSTATDVEKSRAESRVWYVASTRAAERLFIFRDRWDYTTRYLPGV